MKKLLFKLFVRVSLLSVVSTFLLACLLVFLWQNAEVQGERLRNHYMPLYTEILTAFITLFLSLSTLSIFLNLNRRFRQSKTTVALSFFLLPALLSSFVALAVYLQEGDDLKTWLLVLVAYLPFWFLLIKSYFSFSKASL